MIMVRPVSALIALFVLAKVNPYKQNDYTTICDRMVADDYNRKHFAEFHLLNTKFNRTTRTFGGRFNMITLLPEFKCVLKTYVYRNNEYKPFAPMDFTVNGCEVLKKNYFGVGKMKEIGNITDCPLKPGLYVVNHFVPDSTKFPPHVPHDNYKISFRVMNKNEFIFQLSIFCRFEEILQTSKPKKN